MNDTLFHVSFPGLGLENIQINRIAWEIKIGTFQLSIYWYGVIIAFAFLLCIFLAYRQAHQYNLKGDDLLDFAILILPISIIGARLYYVAFTWADFADNPLSIFNTRIGGMAFYGGVIGGVLALLANSIYKKIPLNRILDFLVVYLPLGQGIGRWGNFFNQEAFGASTEQPWGMISEGTVRYMAELGGNINPLLPVHPTFFYEFIGNLLIFLVLINVRRMSRFAYQTTAVYALLYGLLRYGVEGLRMDALTFGSGSGEMRISQVLSLAMIVISLLILVIGHIRSKAYPSDFSPFDIPWGMSAAKFIEETEHLVGTDADFIPLEDESGEFVPDHEAETAMQVEEKLENPEGTETDLPVEAEATNTTDVETVETK